MFPLRHYILAGGRSRRFGSDKARHEIEGQPMLTRVARAFAPLACDTIVIARQADTYADLGHATIADAVPDAGPLAGLLTALGHAIERSPEPAWLLLSSCDLHHPAADQAVALAEDITAAHRASVFVGGRFFEPFPGLYHTDLIATVEAQIASDRRSLQHLLGALGDAVCRSLPPPDTALPLDLDVPPAGDRGPRPPTR